MSSPEARQLFADLQSSFSAADRERLNRILERCRTDLENPLEAIGTGSQVTLKRGTALKLVLEGADLAAIAAASSLSEARVVQVLINVQESGVSALYPRFPETLALQKPLDEKGLWKVIKEYLGKPPSTVGVADDKWRPSTAADYLVHTGTLEDVSVSQISSIIANYKDRKQGIEIQGITIKREYRYEAREESHAGQRRLLPISLWFVFGVLMFGWVLWGMITGHLTTGDGEHTGWFQRIFLGGLSALAVVLMLGQMVKQSMEWWLLQKVLASTKVASRAPVSAGQLWKRWFRRDILGLADASGKVPGRSVRGIVVAWIRRTVPFMKKKEAPQPAPPHRVSPLGAPGLTILHARSLPEAPWNIDSISDARNALGTPPVRTLYLWVFDAQDAQTGVYKEQGWLQLGPVHMLLNATALPMLTLWRKGKDLLLPDPASVNAWLASFNDKAGSYLPSGLFGDSLRTKETYLGYPLHTPLCSDGSWEYGLRQLAQRCDLAVVNLSGYDPSHPGLEYELRYLLAGGPPGSFVFMYDHATDADAVIEGVLDVWNEMDPPATAPELIFVRTMRPEISMFSAYDAQFEARMEKRKAVKQRYEQEAAKFVPVAARVLAYLIARGHLSAGESHVLRAGD